MKNKQKIYGIFSVVLLLDQLIKILVRKNMELYEEIKIIPRFFSIYYVENTGAAFSILKDATIGLIVISVVFIVLINREIKKEEQNLNTLSIFSLGIILGGIFGNLVDRVLYHHVIDYLSFTLGSYSFPVFNLADMGITIGLGLLLFDAWKRRKEV
ncbi:MAG: signal peptidase II [Bacilli bacterium]|nr:signal peptidase II [Bacilli bacterium]